MKTERFQMIARRVGNAANVRYWLNLYARDERPYTAAISILSPTRLKARP